MILGPAPSFARVHRMLGALNFIAVSYDMTRVAISNDGRAWFEADPQLPSGYVITETPFFADGRFWIPCRRTAGGAGFVWTENGREWGFVQVVPSNVGDRWPYGLVKLASGVYIAFGFGISGVTHLWSSTDLTTWTNRTDPVSGSDFLSTGATDGSIAVIRSAFANFATSTDGASFTSRTSGLSSGTPTFTKYLNGGFISGGGLNNDKIAVSSTGTSWTNPLTGVSGSAKGVAFAASRYVFPGSSGGSIRHTADLSTFATATVPSSYDGGAIGIAALGEERIIVASDDLTTQFIRSDDGGQNFEEITARLPFERARWFVGRD